MITIKIFYTLDNAPTYFKWKHKSGHDIFIANTMHLQILH